MGLSCCFKDVLAVTGTVVPGLLYATGTFGRTFNNRDLLQALQFVLGKLTGSVKLFSCFSTANVKHGPHTDALFCIKTTGFMGYFLLFEGIGV